MNLPPPAGRRERRRLETGQRIIEAAIQLFGTRGYAATTVEEITQAADVAKGTFFNYFETKEHLVAVIFDRLGGEFDAFQAGAAEAKHIRPYVTRFVHHFIETPRRNPMLLRTIFGMAITEPKVGDPFTRLLRRARAANVTVLRRGQKVGEIRPDISAEVLARTFQQFIFGTEVLWSLYPGEDLHEWADVMLEVFWRGASVSNTAKRQEKKGRSK